MDSLPMQPFYYDKDSVFPSSISQAFTYHNGYNQEDTLSEGVGYWLKYNTPEMLEVPGTMITIDTFGISTGWNMIGSITYPVLVSSITSEPPSIVTSEFYHYVGDADYALIDTIKPGYGYWVKTNQAGQLILSSSATTMAKNRIRIILRKEIPPPPPDDLALETGRNRPLKYELGQNYPNPFNPTTEVSFVISNLSFVTLRVYDILGREVATLVDEVKQPGEYTVQWNGAGVPSGVYFYRLTAGSFVETKKLVLLR